MRYKLLLVLLLLGFSWANAQDSDLTILNVDPNGDLVDGGGTLMGISGNGRYALIWSDDPLLPKDTVGQQVYVHDLETGTLELISVDFNGNPVTDGTQEQTSNTNSNRRYISDDGRYAMFSTTTANVVDGVSPVNPFHVQLYMRDRQTQTTTVVSVNNDDEISNREIFNYTMDPSGVAVLFQTEATNLDPDAQSSFTWFLHRTDALIGSSVRTQAACRDRDGIPRNCSNPSISCGGAITAMQGSGPWSWVEGEELPFGGRYSDIMIGNTIAGNWVRVGAEADVPLPPDDFINNDSGSAPAINCSGNRIVFWTEMALRLGDTNDIDLYVFDLLSRQLWLIEESPGVSLRDIQGNPIVAMDSSGLQIAFSTDKSLDPRDDNTFNDIYAFEMPPNPGSLEFEFTWVSNNNGVAPFSVFTGEPRAGGNGVVGFRTNANNAPWPINGNGGTFGQLYARSNLPREFITVDGFE